MLYIHKCTVCVHVYMLEGVSRWNMGRAKEAVDVEGASTLRSFDVRLMSHLSNLSQRVLGSTLVPEFTPPGKPTSERIAVEYLLAQTNRGDLLAPNQVPEVPSQVLEEEDEPDDTISMTDILCQSAAIGAGDPPGAVVGDAEPGPLVTQTSQCDSRSVVGWDAVDNLAGYLVGLNRTITALSLKEEVDIVQLYTALHVMDKKHSSYTQKARKKGKASGGPWRAPMRPSGSAPGQQAAESPDHIMMWESCIVPQTIHDSRPSSPGSRTPQGGGAITKHDAASSGNSCMESWSSTYQPPPTNYQSWTSFLQAPPEHSQEYSSAHQLPPAHTQGWSTYQAPLAHSHVWSSTQPPPSASNQGWSATHPPPSASSQGWPSTHPPPSASNQGWSATHPPPLSILPGLAFHPPTTLSVQLGLVCHPPTTLRILPGLACHPPTTLRILPGLACHPPTTLRILPGLVIHLLLS
ncbi:unnamed protein product [Boreogadus saida]